MVKKKNDVVKIVAIILAILFFILWMVNVASNVEESNAFVNYDNKILLLHQQWQYAYNTLNNCYENNMPSCTVDIPQIK